MKSRCIETCLAILLVTAGLANGQQSQFDFQTQIRNKNPLQIPQTTNSATTTELNTAPATWTVGSGVTNSGGGTYTFAVNSTGALTSPAFAVTTGTHYLIAWTYTGCGAVTVALGSVSATTFWSCSDTGVNPTSMDLIAGTTGNASVTFTPAPSTVESEAAGFHGTLSAISVKQIVSLQPASIAQLDGATGSSNAAELRSNLSAENIGWGGNSLASTVPGRTDAFGLDGTFNSGFGFNVLAANSSGYWNFGGGTNALASNGSGFFNTATGVDSLEFNRYGFRNTCTGVLSCQQNIGGFLNTADGDEALNANIDGANNVAIGPSTLQDAQHGRFNTGVGVAACNLFVGGVGASEDNVCIGASALQDQTGGLYNTAVGTNAGQCTNADGSVPTVCVNNHLTAIGGSSLFFVQDGANDDTAIGFYSGNDFLDINNVNKHITTDSQMTLLGENATKNSSSILTNSTCIGYRAYCTASNEVVLGNGSVGTWNFGGGYSWTYDPRLGTGGVRFQAIGQTNTISYITTAPNGTATESGFRSTNSSDPNNAGFVSYSMFGSQAQISAGQAGTGVAPTTLFVGGMAIMMTPVNVIQLPACNGTNEGTMQPVKDANTNVYGANISGGGSYHLLAYCTGGGGWTAH